MLLQSRRAQSDASAALLILWVVCQHCCFDCVLERVQILRFAPPHRKLPLLQGLTSVFRERTLQQLHQHRSTSTSVHRLPLFQKSSPDLESIRWIAQSRDHLDCSIFRVLHQHERKLLHSFLSSIVPLR